jgi:hypothetical protein
MQMLLESSFFFCTKQVTKSMHSGEAATAGEDGVTRTVIKSLRGRRGGRHRVFAASSLGVATREKYAAMEAGGARWQRPPKRGSSKTGQPQAAAAEKRAKQEVAFDFYRGRPVKPSWPLLLLQTTRGAQWRRFPATTST